MSERWSVLKLQANDLVLIVLPGIGGRLWDVIFRGRSLLFQNPDLVGFAIDDIDLANLPTRSPQFKFPLWGGEKTWIAPDTAWADGAPFPVLDSGPYEITAQGQSSVALTSRICPASHLSVTRHITVTSATGWSISHSVTNHGKRPRDTGIWSVMMISTPARICAQMDIPEIHPVFGDAGSMVVRGENGVIARCSKQQEFKVGLHNPTGKTLIKIDNDGPWLICSAPRPAPSKCFAHTYPLEVFNSGDYPYCEAEWHSPLAKLQPDQSVKFHQEFHIWDGADPHLNDIDTELITCMS